MPALDRRAVLDAFLAACETLELDPARDRLVRDGALPYFAFPAGRAGEPWTHEAVALDAPPAAVVAFARAVAGSSPHLVSAVGTDGPAAVGAYAAAGYAPWGTWPLMTRPPTGPAAVPGDPRAVPIADDATERRVLRAVRAAGGSGHPQRAAFVGDPKIRQRWVDGGGEPACFGRLVLLGGVPYLGDVLTLPAHRRRGHAAALCRKLLDDGLAGGAQHCVLASTPMASGLYAGLGFAEVMAITGFQTDGG